MAPSNRGANLLGRALGTPTVGSLLVLLAFCVIFSLTTDTFLAAGNLSLVIQQSVIVGTLAIGQTMIILTAGIDLANGSIAVLGTIVAGRLVNEGNNAALCLLFAIFLCTCVGLVAGALVSRLNLPPFIVTLGLLGIVTAATRLFSQGGSFPVTDDLLGWTGNSWIVGGTGITHGMVIMLGSLRPRVVPAHANGLGSTRLRNRQQPCGSPACRHPRREHAPFRLYVRSPPVRDRCMALSGPHPKRRPERVANCQSRQHYGSCDRGDEPIRRTREHLGNTRWNLDRVRIAQRSNPLRD